MSVAIGNGRTHGDVVLPRVAVQQGLKRCQKRHVQRYVMATAERFERLSQFLGQLDGLSCPTIALHRRPLPIGR